MSDNQLGFQSLRRLFYDYLWQSSKSSAEYQDLCPTIDATLVLGDRVLAAFRDDRDFGRIWNVAERLEVIEQVQAAPDRYKQDRAAEELLEDSELWLKALLWLVDPDAWNRHTATQEAEKHFGLYRCIRTLELLSQAELDLNEDQYNSIADPMHQLVFLAYRYRNPLTHSPKYLPASAKDRLLEAGMAILLAPLYKYRSTIRTRLLGLITSPIEQPEIESLLRLMSNERQRHLDRFAGRVRWLQDLRQRLGGELRDSGGYLLLIGQEGMGKSALCAKLTQEIGSDINPFGRHADAVRKVAPWLPGILFHSGKLSKQTEEIVSLLVSQINTMLLIPVEIPQTPEYAKGSPGLGLETLGMLDQMSPLSRALQQGDSPGVFDTLSKYQAFQPEVFQDAHQLASGGTQIGDQDCRRVLYQALDRLAQERGPTTLIIDAVDEIASRGSGLGFLPERLPPGVSVLLTARRRTEVVNWLISNREADTIQLKGLEQTEIPLLTHVDSLLSTDGARFNQRVWQTSQGWPLLVQRASNLARECEGPLSEIQLDRTLDSVLERQATEWRSCASKAKPKAIHDLLLLLDVFEPVSALDLDLIQAYLEYQEVYWTLPELRQHLQPISAQLEGLEAGLVKLGLKAFADYVRERYLSPLDFRRTLQYVVDWLGVEPDAEARLLAAFLQYWTDRDHVDDARLRGVAENLVDKLIERRSPALLYEIYRFSQKARPKRKDVTPYAARCLHAAAEMGNEEAMRVLGLRLLDGKGLARDLTEGERWLRAAAEKGELRAMIALGERLLDGVGLRKDPKEGEQWLRTAADDGNTDAIGILAIRLLEGNGLDRDTTEGEQLLRYLAGAGNEQAIYHLANRLIDGTGLPIDADEGGQMLRGLAATGNPAARRKLASRLLDGAGIGADRDEGSELLRILASEGNASAIVELGIRLLFGQGLPKNTEEGERWLRQAMDAGVEDVAGLLAIFLLDGVALAQDQKEGEQLLLRSAEAGNLKAMTELGKRLIAGQNIVRSAKKGEQWLLRAAESGSPDAMYSLGWRLLDGNGIPRKSKKGEQWLRQAADANHPKAMGFLGSRLLDGKGLAQNVDEGSKLLRQAAALGEARAMGILGNRLLSGQGMPRSVAEGEIWLRRAAEAKQLDSMVDLGSRLLHGDGLASNVDEGVDWLRKAAAAGSLRAMTTLGDELIIGDQLAKDAKEGEMWLRQAAERGHARAMGILGGRLLEGEGLTKNQTEAEQLLRKAAGRDDPLAMRILGLYLLERGGEHKDIKAGERWLRRAANDGDAVAMGALSIHIANGRISPLNSKEASEWRRKALEQGDGDEYGVLGRKSYLAGDLESAAAFLLKGVSDGSKTAANNLTYMLRRSEVPVEMQAPPVQQLLAPLIAERDVYGLINHALCLAGGFQCLANWEAAESVIATLSNASGSTSDAMEWWYEQLASKGDPEGHLVIGWLTRLRLIEDPDGMSVAERMTLARAGGWDVPEWMNTRVPLERSTK